MEITFISPQDEGDMSGMVFFWQTSHLRWNRSASLERDMEKWVFMIPITTFALVLALIMLYTSLPVNSTTHMHVHTQIKLG